ncbi:hypothetical protein SAY86_027488 [Trapa natans]|uniref:F-box associated beta-propeller type 3 domain-containing protein n=1 Tax=Trapa natans TaxID=22666 RepID=A0AAN7QKR0_TRANT|nr:hypothetical protein SAY86_027488 [Trapa natans]
MDSSSSSAVAMASYYNGYLPIEILVEILKRLPGGTLHKFQRDPTWRSFVLDNWFVSSRSIYLLSHPRFLVITSYKDQLGYYKRTKRFMYSVSTWGDWSLKQDASGVKVPAPSMDYHLLQVDYNLERDYEVPRAVMGLVCLKMKTTIVIYNPTTGEDVCLPRKLSRDHYFKYNYHRWTSLCYDPVGKQHKVLDSFRDLWVYTTHYHVFVAGRKAWRKLDHGLPFEMIRHHCGDEVCVNGVLYYTVFHNFQRTQHLVCFDVRDENFKLVQFQPPDHHCQGPNLTEFFDGRVALVYTPVFYPRKFSVTSENVDAVHLMILEEGCGWRLKEVKLPSSEALPRYGRLRFSGSIGRGEVLAFAWTPDDINTFFIFYDARNDAFWKPAKIEFAPPPPHEGWIDGFNEHPTSFMRPFTPDAGFVFISDHEERLSSLEEW